MAGVPLPDGYDAIPWLRTSYVNAVTQFDALPAASGGVVFVGDSLTNEGRWAEVWPDLAIRNLGVPGDTSWGVLARQGQVVQARPQRIFLMIGTNDLGAWGKSPTSIAANIDALLAIWTTELPQTRIFVQALLPRGAEFQARIVELNTLIAVAARRHGATYVDTHTPFLVAGQLDPTLTVDDLHLTGQGYLRWRAIIQDCVAAAPSCA